MRYLESAFLRFLATKDGGAVFSGADSQLLMGNLIAAVAASVVLMVALRLKAGRFSLGFLVLSLLLGVSVPIAGPFAVLIIAILFLRRRESSKSEEGIVSGNPLIDSPNVPEESAGGDSSPGQICRTMRSLDSRALARVVLGLRGALPSNRARRILGRFQQETGSVVQFYAQSALNDEVEKMERMLYGLKKKLGKDPGDERARITLAEIFLQMAGKSSGHRDRAINIEEARSHLDHAGESLSAAVLRLRVALATGRADEATRHLATVKGYEGGDAIARRFRGEWLHLQRKWTELHEEAMHGGAASDGTRKVMKFWAGASPVSS